MKRRRTRVRALCAASLLTIPAMGSCPTARADEAGDTAAARVLGTDGVLLADAGKCGQAIEKLVRAEKLHHAHTTAARLGECEIEMGKVVAGTERLQRVVREPLAPSGPPAAIAAVARARGVLEKALPRIAMLRISVKAPAEVRPVVTVDGEPLPEAVLDNDRPSDPGAHQIRVTADGFYPDSLDVSLGDAEVRSVHLELRPMPIAAPPPAKLASRGDAAPVETKGSNAPAVVAFVFGGVGIGVGAVTGAMVAAKASSLDASCSASRVCPPERQSDIDSAKTLATVSTISFLAGGAAVATGFVLLFIEPRANAERSGGLVVRPTVGAHVVGIDGAF